MSEGHDTIDIRTRSYRFSGYKLNRDRDNNVISLTPKSYQPEYWKTRAFTGPQGSQPYISLGSK